jgi:hypothetical protein
MRRGFLGDERLHAIEVNELIVSLLLALSCRWMLCLKKEIQRLHHGLQRYGLQRCRKQLD